LAFGLPPKGASHQTLQFFISPQASHQLNPALINIIINNRIMIVIIILLVVVAKSFILRTQYMKHKTAEQQLRQENKYHNNIM